MHLCTSFYFLLFILKSAKHVVELVCITCNTTLYIHASDLLYMFMLDILTFLHYRKMSSKRGASGDGSEPPSKKKAFLLSQSAVNLGPISTEVK